MTTARDDCEKLIRAALPFAEEMLKRHGEFFLYGTALKENGEVVGVSSYDGRGNPPSEDTIRRLKQDLVHGAESGECKATALAYDVTITLPTSGEKSDAIAVSLNHRDGYSAVVFLPYRIGGSRLVFGERFEESGEADIFGSD